MGENDHVDISARTEYAVRAMLLLAQAQATGSGPVSVDSLATAQSLPRKFLEAIAADLRTAGLVTSTRGPRGGYVMARPATEVVLGDVFRAVDGPLAEVRGLRPHQTAYEGVAAHLPEVWVAVRASLRAGGAKGSHRPPKAGGGPTSPLVALPKSATCLRKKPAGGDLSICPPASCERDYVLSHKGCQG